MPTTTWAKLDREAGTALPLVDHLLDVGTVFAELLAGGAWTAVLEATAGRPLTAQDVARLTALAALHDIGKANSGFQARIDRRADLIGHEGQVAALVFDCSLRATPAGLALGELYRDWGAGAYFPALMAHHGRPREEFATRQRGTPPWTTHRKHWQPAGDYHPDAEVVAAIAAVRARWPRAWEPGASLPRETRFVALFAGLVTLADWIGSDTARFPVGAPHGSAREAMRAERAADAVAVRGLAPTPTPAGGFEAAFGFTPRGVQAQADADDLGPVALIEAETGAGKTEAALWRWVQLRRRGLVDGLYFALPTRSAAVQLHTRVGAMLKRLWGEAAPEAVLAVPGYLRAGDAEGHALPGRAVRWDDGPGDDSRWAAERAQQFLAARIAVGTVDQALWAALRVRHAPVRAAALARSLLVVDEVHASDAYTGALLERLLANHAGAGGQALLLSATLGGTARARLLGQSPPTLAEAEAAPYPALSGRAVTRPAAADGPGGKSVRIEIAALIDDPDAIAALAVEAAGRGASVLVVRNSVRGAVAVAQAVEALAPHLAFRVEGVATLHHGRFAPDDRRTLDAAVERAFGKGRSAQGRVLVGTQTLEQSLDIDADLLVTDLAPMDVLLQRIGRLHRHPRDDRGDFAQARAVILRPADRDLASLLGRGRAQHGLGPMRDRRGVYPDVVQLEATLRLLETNPAIAIPADNRRLVERALHPDAATAILAGADADWANHAAHAATITHADRDTAARLSLDLAVAFSDLVFPDAEEAVLTRLGARDLLVDLDPPIAGPFGAPVARLALPHWMAPRIASDGQPELLDHDASGQRFRLGDRAFRYGRWGLAWLRDGDVRSGAAK